MHVRLIPLLSLLTLALLLAVAEPARADGGHAHAPGTLVDGYTVTFVGPEDGAKTGAATVIVTLHDALERPLADAGVSASLLAYLPAESGHGETHGAAPADSHSDAAPTDSHAQGHEGDAQGHEAMPGMAADMPGMAGMAGMSASGAASTDSHGSDHDGGAQSHEAMPGMSPDMPGMAAPPTSAAAAPAAEDGHDHSGASATEGLMPIPVALNATDEPGTYQGTLSFDKAGTYTVGVVFVADGKEHGATFELAVAQSRPRGLVLGGFALLNAAVIGAAAVLRRRAPRKPVKSPAARPAPTALATTSTEEQPK